jgi:hypothetical protein
MALELVTSGNGPHASRPLVAVGTVVTAYGARRAAWVFVAIARNVADFPSASASVRQFSIARSQFGPRQVNDGNSFHEISDPRICGLNQLCLP